MHYYCQSKRIWRDCIQIEGYNSVNRRYRQSNRLVGVLLTLAVIAVACSAPASQGPATSDSPAISAASSKVGAVAAKLNLNTVSEQELLRTIPDFGNRMVREFFEYRPYISIQQFRREIGKYVDEAQVAAYEQYVYVPVNVNESDTATLIQIPGVDTATAEALMAARPYASNAAFLDKLAELVTGIDRTSAERYLEVQ
jgi:DNA uptake protein ComE-like DNA-binding protein